MSNVISFKPDERNSAINNIISYVAYYRSIISDNEIIKDWNALSWGGIYRFTRFDSSDNRNCNQPLNESFIDFAKAYIKCSILFGKRKEHTKALRVLKVLEFVLLDLVGNANVNECNHMVLDKCASIIYEKYTKSVSANACKELEKIINFLKSNRMIDLPHLDWVSPLRFKARKSWDGYDKNLKGHSKLPDIESILVIARILLKRMKNFLKEICLLLQLWHYSAVHPVGFLKFWLYPATVRFQKSIPEALDGMGLGSSRVKDMQAISSGFLLR